MEALFFGDRIQRVNQLVYSMLKTPELFATAFKYSVGPGINKSSFIVGFLRKAFNFVF